MLLECSSCHPPSPPPTPGTHCRQALADTGRRPVPRYPPPPAPRRHAACVHMGDSTGAGRRTFVRCQARPCVAAVSARARSKTSSSCCSTGALRYCCCQRCTRKLKLLAATASDPLYILLGDDAAAALLLLLLVLRGTCQRGAKTGAQQIDSVSRPAGRRGNHALATTPYHHGHVYSLGFWLGVCCGRTCKCIVTVVSGFTSPISFR